jgi:hypothetical protein
MRNLLISAICSGLVACAGGEVPPPSAAHPASPNAPEGTAYVAPPATSAAPATSTHDHHGHEGDPNENVTYTCPMHPEVVSDKPGQCPKCGMNLVPKKKDSP